MEMSDYTRRCLAQTIAWANGYPMHNQVDGECCPDFSCCRPDLFEKSQDKRMEYFVKMLIEKGIVQ